MASGYEKSPRYGRPEPKRRNGRTGLLIVSAIVILLVEL